MQNLFLLVVLVDFDHQARELPPPLLAEFLVFCDSEDEIAFPDMFVRRGRVLSLMYFFSYFFFFGSFFLRCGGCGRTWPLAVFHGSGDLIEHRSQI